MSTQIQLYLIAGIEVLVPIFALLLLRKKHTFRLTSVFGGVAAYFLTCEVLIPGIGLLFSVLGLGADFWTEHAVLSELINIVLNAVVGTLALYFILRFTLKNRSRIYDAMAMGISYWLYNSIRLAISAVSYGRLAYMNANGRLSEMVNDSLSMERLQELAAELTQEGIVSFYVQLFGILCLTVIAVASCLFLYYAVKRSSSKVLWLTIGANFVLIAAINFSLMFGGNVAYIIANILAAAVAGYAIYRFMAWYRQQQLELSKKRKAYREGLKNTTE